MRGSGATFWGFDPDVPLDLGDLGRDAYESIQARLADRSMPALSETIARVGNCSRPIRLSGHADTVDAATGEVVESFASADQPLGLLYKPCGNRRADVCPACSRIYARDTFELISTGLHGGKGVPESVQRNPLLFVTLTAPSFGAVHGVRDGKPCHPRDGKATCSHGRRLACWVRHEDGDPDVGAPLCPECYDVETAAVWQWFAPELWRRFTITLRRRLADALDVRPSELPRTARLEYAKVAEFQTRGLVHFHALIRLDGPDGPGSPSLISALELREVIREAASAVWYAAPPTDSDDVTRLLRFGTQTDIRVVRDGALDGEDVTAEQVAAYLAKYSTKSTGVDPSRAQAHLRRLRDACRALAARALTGCPNGCAERAAERHPNPCAACTQNVYALLGRWAPMLGFRGHFSTKSRRYSVTLGALRRARRRFQRWAADANRRGTPLDTAELEARLMAEDDEETTLVMGSWVYAGSGWPRVGDKTLAEAAAARAREYAQWKSSKAA